MDDESSNEKSQILSDISLCLSKDRLDDAMLVFLHLYEELDDKIASDKEITSCRNLCNKLLSNIEFRMKLDMFYKIMAGEDGLLLLDKSVHDNIYILDMELYKTVKDISIKVYLITGKIKKMILSDSESDLHGFDRPGED